MIDKQKNFSSVQIEVEVPVGKEHSICLMSGVVDMNGIQPGWMSTSTPIALAKALNAKVSSNPLGLVPVKGEGGIRKL